MKPHDLTPFLKIAAAFALREARGGMKSMRLMLLAMALGVALITAIGVVRDSLFTGIEADSRTLLGGDISLSRTYQAARDDELAWMQKQGRVSHTVELRSMATLLDGPKEATPPTRLIELKAVDETYPLNGAVQLEPATPVHELLAERDGHFGVAVDRDLLKVMNANIGDRLRIGEKVVMIRAVLTREPDRVTNTYLLGPRVLASQAMLDASGLIAPGSIVTYRYRVALENPANAEAAVAGAQTLFAKGGWKMQTWHNAAPRLKELLDRLQRYIGLVGLAVLVTGGMGVANAVTAWFDRRQSNIAILKSVGTPMNVIAMTYAIQLLIAATLAVSIGMLAGCLAPGFFMPMFEGALPISPIWKYKPGFLVAVASFSLLTACTFGYWPLYRATQFRPAQIFRAGAGIVRGDAPVTLFHIIGYAAAIGLMALLAGKVVGDIKLTLVFASGVALGMVALAALATGIRWLASRMARQGRLEWRYALANLSRPHAPTASVILSLGMGTALLVAVMLMKDNMLRQVGGDLPEEAPTYFVLDIPEENLAAFESIGKDTAGISQVITYPAIHGRITAIKGMDAAHADITPEVNWAIQGDRVLSFSDEPPPESAVKQGTWWPKDYDGAPQLSITEDLAKGMHLKTGDQLTVEVLGQPITATVTSIRDVNWRNYRMNFALIFSPTTLSHLPHNYMATLKTRGEDADAAFLTAMSGAMPSVPVVRLKEALQDASALVMKIAQVVQAVALVATAMGIAVMATAIAATQSNRMFDHTMFKVLGATRRRILTMLATEFTVTGVSAVLAAWVLGSLATWVMMTEVMRSPFELSVATLLGTGFFALLTAVLLGLGLTWRLLTLRPLRVLRND
ncbi:FtsX-like permease family protein [bacterium]|nr:FtsX-like permease family protein [bacterium]